jgi:hypothetical protein
MNLINYFENITYFFEEEDSLPIEINKKINFFNAKEHMGTQLAKLKEGCYQSPNHIHGNPGFTIKIKDGEFYYFYNFYVTFEGSNTVKLVFGICNNPNYNSNELNSNYNPKHLNGVGEKILDDLTLEDIVGFHDATVKIDIPITVRNNFFGAILKYILEFGLIEKNLKYRGHLQPDEIPFANLASKINNATNLNTDTLKKLILDKLNEAKIYSEKMINVCKNFIINNPDLINKFNNENPKKQNLTPAKKITLTPPLIDKLLEGIDESYFTQLHSGAGDVTYGRAYSFSINTFKKYLKDKTLDEFLTFYVNFLDKIVFFIDEIDKIKTNDKQLFIKKFNQGLIKLRAGYFHRDKLYRLIVKRVLRIGSLLKDEKFYDPSQLSDNLKDIKNKILNNIIEILKRKEVTAKVNVSSPDNSRNYKLKPKNFTLKIYNSILDKELKNYFDLLEDELFNPLVIEDTIKMIEKDLSSYIVNSIVVNNPTGWVDVNTSSKILNDV